MNSIGTTANSVVEQLQHQLNEVEISTEDLHKMLSEIKTLIRPIMIEREPVPTATPREATIAKNPSRYLTVISQRVGSIQNSLGNLRLGLQEIINGLTNG